MRYFSTRDKDRERPFALKDAAFLGLAPDGGLFIPESIPQVDLAEVEALAGESYSAMAAYLAQKIFPQAVSHDELTAMLDKAYDFECPLVKMEGNIYNLQLFHGPTYAFKDFGARFMGGMLGLLNKGTDDLIVLTATSGDTGSAVANGFYDVPGIKVVVLYPEGKVSNLQESQMTTLGKNINPIRVKGNFDDCQALVKAIFNDGEFRKSVKVTSANSINLLRWVPQSFYYFYAWCAWKKATGKTAPDIVVPSGNYGNITAGMLAQKMGMPVRRWVAASNANDVVPEFLRTGEYKPRSSVQTIANAMDVGAPSNYERMMYLYEDDYARLTSEVSGFSCSDADIKEGIRDIYNRCGGYISDPHSAVAYNAARHYDIDGFYLSTAHAAKFGEVIGPVLGVSPDIPQGLRTAMQKQKAFTTMNNSIDELKNFISKINAQ